MTKNIVDLDALPVRFHPPDGWRTPHPLFISLYQAEEFSRDWQPYPQAPSIPPNWPWWEDNGTSWYTFFRDRAPLPARSLGNWFSLAALGLFSIAVSPFALPGWFIAAGGLFGLACLIVGIRGVIRTIKRQSSLPVDPFESLRMWARERRDTYFHDAYTAFVATQQREISYEQFVSETLATWWAGNPSDEVS
jgi:hypothetical protein